MKHADLIRAVLDGKLIQYQLQGGSVWYNLCDPNGTIRFLTSDTEGYKLRIKPEPKPDTVLFFALGVSHNGFFHTTGCWNVLKHVVEKFTGGSGITYDTCAKIKFTINGETGEQTVEIVPNGSVK